MAQLVWASARQLGLSDIFSYLWLTREWLSAEITVYILLGKEGPSEFDQFQELSEAIISCLLSLLRSFLPRENCNLIENCHKQGFHCFKCTEIYNKHQQHKVDNLIRFDRYIHYLSYHKHKMHTNCFYLLLPLAGHYLSTVYSDLGSIIVLNYLLDQNPHLIILSGKTLM